MFHWRAPTLVLHVLPLLLFQRTARTLVVLDSPYDSSTTQDIHTMTVFVLDYLSKPLVPPFTQPTTTQIQQWLQQTQGQLSKEVCDLLSVRHHDKGKHAIDAAICAVLSYRVYCSA